MGSWHKIGEEPMSKNDIFTASFIPLFHTGHESPESPRIDFFFLFGGWGVFVRFHYFFFSNRDELRVIPHSDTMSLRIFGGFGSNDARMHYD